MSNLTNKKHIAFVDEYFVNGFNATRAYKKAYPTASDETCVTNASRLLTNANVKEEVDRRQAINKARYEINKDEIVDVVKGIMLNTKDVAPPFALKAAEILIKMAGLFSAEKIETSFIEQPLFSDDDLNKE